MSESPDRKSMTTRSVNGLPKQSGFDQECFDEFIAIMGVARTAEWIDRLDARIGAEFADVQGDPDALRKTVHSLVAQAGTVGFLDFAELCAELETSISNAEDYDEKLKAVQSEALHVAAVLALIRSELKKRSSSP